MITVGFDGNEANVDHKVGVSVYTQNLLNFYQKKANKNLRFNVYLRNSPIKTMPKENKYFRYQLVKGKIFTFSYFIQQKIKFSIDLFF